MHIPVSADWIELIRAVGDLWRLILAVAAILALWLLRHPMRRWVARTRRIRIDMASTRVEIDSPGPSFTPDGVGVGAVQRE